MLALLAITTLATVPSVTYAFQDAAAQAVETADAVTEAVTDTVAEPPADSEPVTKVEYDAMFLVNNLWIMIAGMLVFIMHLGFATLESGLTRSKNTVNILFKNTMIVCIGLVSYGVIGFNMMYPGFDYEPADGSAPDIGYFKIADSGFGFLTNGPEIASLGDDATAEEIAAFNANTTSEYADYTLFTDFFFQAMFAATCCTIVSGAVAGRVKLGTFLIFCVFFVTISYPITGSWKWGGGFLDQLGFYDFAGSTLVHSVGGWGALVMAGLLGARHGKYVDGRPKALAPSSMPLAAIGVFLLWFGWFGFNGGSVLSADPGLVSLVLVTTSMAAAAGGLAAALISTVHGRKPDLSMTLNGVLAGLVGITAGADLMNPIEAIIIGAIAGVLVYFAVIFIDSVVKIDDPVGAISVHLVCGIWGTLAVGLFGTSAGSEQLVAQLIGIGAIGAFTVVFCLIVGLILKFTMGLRVSPEEEMEGLDLGEHGLSAYSYGG
jgi:Amt family ammonium transporter